MCYKSNVYKTAERDKTREGCCIIQYSITFDDGAYICTCKIYSSCVSTSHAFVMAEI